MSDALVTQGAEFRDDARAPSAGVRGGGDYLPKTLLAPLLELDDRRSLAAVAWTLGGTLVTLAFALGFWSWWAVLIAVPLIAAQQHAMFVLIHEAAHYRLFANRRANDLLGRALGGITGISMCAYRVIHRLHHNQLFSEVDPDIALVGGYPRGRAYLVKKLLTDLSGLTAWKTYRYFFGAPAANSATQAALRPLDDTAPALRAQALADRRTVITTQLGLLAGVLLIGGPQGLLAYLLLWILPATTLLQAILRTRAIAEHGAPRSYESPLTAARTNLVGPLLRFFMFPHHVNYHVAHHLYPAVPHYHLPALHALLEAHGWLREAEVRRFAATWERVFADPVPAQPR